ncbi:FadR/GntR family transcriptional regulator [Xanthobacter sp. KR7-65]|uniref:FadR/GntR family transcriptional regulator n=1 Tax=Xanthobacter sp. KR7-65 TaxID=3156612 RepID=UPI0032B4F09D
MLSSPPENIRDRSREAAREIRRFIEEGIASNVLNPGDKLPNERDLAERFGIGRNSVRKVLIALEQEGRIERSVGRGTFVAGTLTNAESAPAVGKFFATISRTASPLDLMEFRLAVEPSIIESAVHRASSADIDLMQAALDRSRTATTLQEFETCDEDLHRAIAAASRNPLYIAAADIITGVRAEAEWGMLKKRTLTGELRRLHTSEHEEIVASVRRRDPMAARSAMVAHLVNVRRMMFPQIEPK